MKKKIISVILVMAFALSLFNITCVSAETTASGTCGANITWTLDSDGVLTLSGSGNMYNYITQGDAPWYKHRTNIKKVIISEEITSIGISAFYNCVNLTEVNIPEGVTNIPQCAFQLCTSLEEIEIPENVTYIGLLAFGECSGLKSLKLPENLSSMSTYAFASSGLESIIIPAGITNIPEKAFYYCESLSNIVLPASITNIGPNAFGNCRSLADVYYIGSEDDWNNNITINTTGNSVLTYANFYYNSVMNPTSISLSSTSVSMVIGNTRTLTVTMEPESIVNKEIIWQSSNEDVATVNNGIITANAVGSATITATSQDGGCSATCAVTVKAPVNVTSFTLRTTSVNMKVGDTYSLSAEVRPYGATNSKVIWTSSDSSIVSASADVGGLALSGAYTLRKTVLTAKKEGTVTIMGTTEDGGFTGICTVTVLPTPITGIMFISTEETIPEEGSITLEPIAIPGGELGEITWTSDNTDVATVNNGVVTGISPGSAIITATTVDGGFTATCTITVTAIAKIKVSAPITNIPSGYVKQGEEVTLYTPTRGADIYYTIDGTTPSETSTKYVDAFTIDTSAQIRAIAVKKGMLNSEIAYFDYTMIDSTIPFLKVSTNAKANKGDLATVSVSITENSKAVGGSFNLIYDNTVLELISTTSGTYSSTANPMINEQYANNAIRMVWGGVNELNSSGDILVAQFKVTSNEKSHAAFSLDKAKLGDADGRKLTIQSNSGNLIIEPKIIPSTNDATNITETSATLSGNLTADITDVERYIRYWAANDTETIYTTEVQSGTGDYIVDIDNLVKNTEYQYQMTSEGEIKTFKTLSGEPEIIGVSSISLNKNTVSIEEGKTETLVASINPVNATNSNVSWTISNENVATVEDGIITAVSAGVCTITVTSEDGGFSSSCEITVIHPTISVTGISLDKSTVDMIIGESQTIYATLTPSNADNQKISWTSSDNSIVTVSNGVLTANGIGTASITAISDDGKYTAMCNVTVVEKPQLEQVSAPKSSIANGYISIDTKVYISSDTASAKIYYTTDGSQPSATNGTLYTSYINITEDMTIKAIAIKDNMEDSKISQFTYRIIGEDTPTIQVESVKGKSGETVDVRISLKNNPGIATMRIDVTYDKDVMTLSGVTDAGTITGQVHSTDYTAYPYSLYWENGTITENIVVNDTIATLSFAIKENIDAGSYPIIVSYDIDNYDIFNVDLEPVEFIAAPGQITIGGYIYGDVNDDGKVNALDSVIMSRYIAKWPNVSVNLEAADVNADGKVNALDSVILKRHIAKWPAYLTLPY